MGSGGGSFGGSPVNSQQSFSTSLNQFGGSQNPQAPGQDQTQQSPYNYEAGFNQMQPLDTNMGGYQDVPAAQQNQYSDWLKRPNNLA